jgi:hypothetical protein
MMERADKTTKPWLVCGAIILAIVSASSGCGNHDPIRLPYDRSNPVVYDNDEAVDVYVDEYLLALASLGEIQLKGMLTSSSIKPFNQWVPAADYTRMVNDRRTLAAAAKASGFRQLPELILGPMGELEKPASGRIEDTRSIGAEGSWFIVKEARKASPEKPLVVVAGGPLTAEADAYLLDPTIANKVIVAWLGGRKEDMGDYNGWADPWAAYIVLEKLRLVQFPYQMAPPRVTKSELLSLPASPLRDFMYRAHHPSNDLPGNYDNDAQPAIGLSRSDYALQVKHVSFDRWVPVLIGESHDVPAFRVDEQGRGLVVTDANQGVATSEWWRAIRKAFSQSVADNK